MLKKATVAVLLPLLLVMSALALVNSGSSQGRSNALPPGKWAVSAHAYVGPMYESQPVKVIGVVSDAAQGVKITTFGLRNSTSKVVSAVSLTWYVTSEQTGDEVLLQGETEPVSIEGGLPAGKSQYIEKPVVSFGDISKVLLKRGALRGAYSIEVAVTGIQYEDGSTWTGDPKNMVAAVKAGLHFGPAPQGCAGQMCQYDAGSSVYICVAGPGQLCTNCGRRCLSSVCGELAPSCGPGGGGE
jgi:hypothetical protein